MRKQAIIFVRLSGRSHVIFADSLHRRLDILAIGSRSQDCLTPHAVGSFRGADVGAFHRGSRPLMQGRNPNCPKSPTNAACPWLRKPQIHDGDAPGSHGLDYGPPYVALNHDVQDGVLPWMGGFS